MAAMTGKPSIKTGKALLAETGKKIMASKDKHTQKSDMEFMLPGQKLHKKGNTKDTEQESETTNDTLPDIGMLASIDVSLGFHVANFLQ